MATAESEHNSFLGKKVFFLYPPSVIREEVLSKLSEQEYEVYLLRDHEGAKKILRKYNDALVFVNIDDGQSEGEWEVWIKNVLSDPVTKNVGIGILSYNAPDALKKKYLMEIGIPCGFIHLKMGLEQGTRIILETLRANEAKGRRKYVRANCSHDKLSSINLYYNGNRFLGDIRDISAVGFSCFFENDPGIPKNALLDNVQLKLRGSLLTVESLVFGKREDAGVVYVMLFTQKVESMARAKVRKYIQTTLQSFMDSELK